MSDQPESKGPWNQGWDLVMSQEDPEAEAEILSGAMSAYATGYDTSDPDERAGLALFYINSMAHDLLLPQPTEENPDPLDTPEKEAAFGKRLHDLAEHLAKAFAQWDFHDRGGHCAECGESLQLDAESVRAKSSDRAN